MADASGVIGHVLRLPKEVLGVARGSTRCAIEGYLDDWLDGGDAYVARLLCDDTLRVLIVLICSGSWGWNIHSFRIARDMTYERLQVHKDDSHKRNVNEFHDIDYVTPHGSRGDCGHVVLACVAVSAFAGSPAAHLPKAAGVGR